MVNLLALILLNHYRERLFLTNRDVPLTRSTKTQYKRRRLPFYQAFYGASFKSQQLRKQVTPIRGHQFPLLMKSALTQTLSQKEVNKSDTVLCTD